MSIEVGKALRPTPDQPHVNAFQALVLDVTVPVRIKRGETIKLIFDEVSQNFRGMEIRGQFYPSNN